MAYTPRGPGSDGAALHAAAHIVAAARSLEDKVRDLRGETDRVRAQQQRWEELKGAGLSSRREAAAADFTLEKVRLAASKEKAAREAELQAFVARRAAENAALAATSRTAAAEDAARRAEERLGEAERALTAWRTSAEATAEHARRRLADAKAVAESRLLEVEREAEAREQAAREALEEERRRTAAVVAQEVAKLDRQYAIKEAVAGAQMQKARLKVQAAEAELAAALRKRDRDLSSVALRAKGARVAAEALVRTAVDTQAAAVERSAHRLASLQSEHGLRLEQARSREAAAREDLEARRRKADRDIAAAETMKAAALADCDEADRAQLEVVERLRSHLGANAARWAETVREAEESALCTVAGVREIAAEWKATLDREVEESVARVEDELGRTAAWLDSHEGLVQRQLEEQRRLATEARRLAEHRVSEVEQLSVRQADLSIALAESVATQAEQLLGTTRDIVDGRIKEAIGQLRLYVDHGEVLPVADEHLAELEN